MTSSTNNNDKVDEYEKLYDYIDNLMPGDCSFMGDELYSKYIEELVLIIIMRGEGVERMISKICSA